MNFKSKFLNPYSVLKDAIETRFHRYFAHKKFSLWSSSKSEAEIKKEFFELSTLRGTIWFDVDKKEIEQWICSRTASLDLGHECVSKESPFFKKKWREDFSPFIELIHKEVVRNPTCITFDYNKAGLGYNGSLIQMGGHSFLALEGPLEKAIPLFFQMLQDTNSSLLVRLTPENEKGIDKCAPYWKDRLNNPLLKIGEDKSIHYVYTDNWKDRSAIDSEQLIQLVLKAKELYLPSQGPLAVHCSGGVGRTGTFIAAYIIMEEIHAQLETGLSISDLKLSIEELVARLSLQRYHMVAHYSQYINLHQFTDLYIRKISSKA